MEAIEAILTRRSTRKYKTPVFGNESGLPERTALKRSGNPVTWVE